MEINVDLAVLLAVILFFRLRPTGEPRSPGNVQVTAALVLVFGLLIASTNTGEMLLRAVGAVVEMLE